MIKLLFNYTVERIFLNKIQAPTNQNFNTPACRHILGIWTVKIWVDGGGLNGGGGGWGEEKVEVSLLYTVKPTFLAKDPASSSSLVFLGQNIKINVRITRSTNIPTTAFLQI